MLNTLIPHDYVEIENIVKTLPEKEALLFLYTQRDEGFTSLLSSLINNLLEKGKKIAVIDLNTHFINNSLFPEDNQTEKETVIKLESNSFKKVNSKEINNLSVYHFSTTHLLVAERVLFLKEFTILIDKIKEENDYVFLQNIPMTSINKNNIQLNELKGLIDKTFFIIRSNFISKIKLTNIKELLKSSGIELSGAIIQDYGSNNLFDEVQRQIDKVKFLFPRKLYAHIKYKLKEYKYSTQL